MASSLSSVVSDLVRAQIGSSVSSSVTDEELDRHVADLIVKEAKKKAELYMQKGVRAYTTNNMSDSNAPRANKRFLSSIIKSTDEHNRTVLKAQADGAEEIKRERREQEKQQRLRRAQEAVEARKGGSGGESSRRRHRKDEESEGWDRWDGRTADRKKEKVHRNWETWDGRDEDEEREDKERKRRRSRSRERHPENSSRSAKRTEGDDPERPSKHRPRNSRSRSPRRRQRSKDKDRSPERDRDRDNDSDSRRRKRRRDQEDSSYHRSGGHSHSRSRSPGGRSSGTDDRKAKKRRRSPLSKYALDDRRDATASPVPRKASSPSVESGVAEREAQLKQRLKNSRRLGLSDQSKRTESSLQREASSSRRSLSPMTISRSPTPGPQPPANPPSKMDRYFEESYDPRLDLEPLAVPQVPATGLINDAEFEGWDTMLELIRLRKEDKAEKKRLERLGLLPPKDKVAKVAKIDPSGAAVAERWNSDGINVMDIEYSKRGSVREWDLGKDGF